MNEKIDLGKIGLGISQPSKSLLTTINLGYNKPLEPEKSEKPILITVPKKEQKKPKKKPLLIKQEIQIYKPPNIVYIEKFDLVTTFSTGFQHNDIPVPSLPVIDIKCDNHKTGEDSIIESIDTGFGCTNHIAIPHCKPKYKSFLCKENYLGEFKTETEKSLARYNLGVYSKQEIDDIVGKILIENNNFVTKKEVQNMISELDFVNSTLRSYANYQIPDDLFKL